MSAVPSKPIRSPSYPSMSLRAAVSAVAKIEAPYRSSPVDRAVAAKLIGYTGLSGPANAALAALASYGLVERAGKGEMRVTGRAQAILHPKNDAERREHLRAAALEPQLFRELTDRFPGIVPPEDGVVTYLHRQNFNQSAIGPAARAFLQTLSYLEEAGATESNRLEEAGGPDSDASQGGDASEYGGAKVGDLVQWESQAGLQFAKPLRVRLVSEDGNWVAVEGSQTGIPMSEVIVEERGLPRTPSPTFPLQEDVGPLKGEEGETEWMRNQVGQSTKVRVLVKGEMGPKEIGKLIRILKAQKAVLEDDVDEDDH